MSKRHDFDEAFDHMYRAITCMGIGDIPDNFRHAAIDALAEAGRLVLEGMAVRAKEREADDEAAIIKAYREGRLVEKA